MSSSLTRHTQQAATAAREDGMTSRQEDSDASSLAAPLEEDETEDEDGLIETGETSTTDNLDADPSKASTGEDGIRRFCDGRAGSAKTG